MQKYYRFEWEASGYKLQEYEFQSFNENTMSVHLVQPPFDVPYIVKLNDFDLAPNPDEARRRLVCNLEYLIMDQEKDLNKSRKMLDSFKKEYYK